MLIKDKQQAGLPAKIARVAIWLNKPRSATSGMTEGLSIIEILVAIAIFLIIASSIVVVVLGAFQSSRLSKEETRASGLAKEGLAAVENIRNQGFDNLVDGSYGLSSAGGSWSFSGSSDLTDAKYTRVVVVESVQRDSNFDIVASGGTVDPDIKKITSTVSWSFTPTRNNQISYVSYLTNWQLSSGIGSGTTPPSINSYAEYCQSLNYGSGTCRANTNQCASNGETYESGGDAYCVGGGSDTCCCAP